MIAEKQSDDPPNRNNKGSIFSHFGHILMRNATRIGNILMSPLKVECNKPEEEALERFLKEFG